MRLRMQWMRRIMIMHESKTEVKVKKLPIAAKRSDLFAP